MGNPQNPHSGFTPELVDGTAVAAKKKAPNGHDLDLGRPVKFSAVTLDGQAFDPIEWMIEGLLPTGLTILAGKSKIGKSWLAMDIAITLAAGLPAFTKIRTTQTDVLYIALEDGRRRLQSRMRKLLSSEPTPAGLIFSNEWPMVGQGCFERIEEHLDATPACRCVIVDTFGKVRGRPDGRSSVYQQDYADMGAFHKLAQRRNIVLLLIHHTRKQDASDMFDQVSGSTGITGASDSIMLLERKRGQLDGTLGITGRDIVEDGKFAISFSKETGKWTMLGEAGQVKAEGEQQRIFDYLLAEPEPAGPGDIAMELEMPLATVKGSLNRLKKKGSVTNPARGLWTVIGR